MKFEDYEHFANQAVSLGKIGQTILDASEPGTAQHDAAKALVAHCVADAEHHVGRMKACKAADGGDLEKRDFSQVMPTSVSGVTPDAPPTGPRLRLRVANAACGRSDCGMDGGVSGIGRAAIGLWPDD